MINGVHHVSFSTTDFDRLVAFYRDLIGLEEIRRSRFDSDAVALGRVVGMPNASGQVVALRGGNVQVEIFGYDTPAGRKGEDRPACDTGVRHLCFDVTDLPYEYGRLRAAGIVFLSEPQKLREGLHAVYGRDPDGNIFELQEIQPPCDIDKSHVHRGTGATA